MSYHDLFNRYGSEQDSAEVRPYLHIQHPRKLTTPEEIAYRDKDAAESIKQLEIIIADLKDYRQALAARYGELETMPYKAVETGTPPPLAGQHRIHRDHHQNPLRRHPNKGASGILLRQGPPQSHFPVSRTTETAPRPGIRHGYRKKIMGEIAKAAPLGAALICLLSLSV